MQQDQRRKNRNRAITRLLIAARVRRTADRVITAHRSPLTAPGLSPIIVFTMLTVIGLAGLAFAGPLDDLKETYSQIKAVEARFEQKLYIMTMKKERTFAGEFIYKRSKGFLWKYNSPKQRLFLYDGKAVWQVEEDKDFVIREKINKQKMEGNFLDLIEDISKIDQLFTLKGTTKEGDTEILSLEPKKEGTLRSARVWTDRAHTVRKIELLEVTGNTNVITFSAVKVNGSVSDSLFLFKPGKKEVIEQ